MKIRKADRYGVTVFESVELEDRRREHCLCLHCQHMVTLDQANALVVGEQALRGHELERMFNCPTAMALYEICVISGVATPVTRCPFWIPTADVADVPITLPETSE